MIDLIGYEIKNKNEITLRVLYGNTEGVYHNVLSDGFFDLMGKDGIINLIFETIKKS